MITARPVNVIELILPAANKKNFEQLPDHLREDINVHFARTDRDVLHFVFDDHLDD